MPYMNLSHKIHLLVCDAKTYVFFEKCIYFLSLTTVGAIDLENAFPFVCPIPSNI